MMERIRVCKILVMKLFVPPTQRVARMEVKKSSRMQFFFLGKKAEMRRPKANV